MTLWSPESASTPALTLRPYQDRAVDAVVTAWASDPRVCLALPTGAGKTVVAAGLIRTAQAEGMRVAFVTDRLTLIPQTIRMFESAGLRCAVVQGDNTSGPGEQSAAHVVICSAQTLDARHIDPNDLDVVMTIVDECHVERAVVARWLDMGVCMCGLTATPLARWMPERWKQLISPVTTREAIDDDWLLEPTFRAEIVDIEKDVSEYIGSPVGPGGDWSDDQAAHIMEPHLDAVVTAWKRVVALPAAEGGFDGRAPQTIVQAATVDHAEALAHRFTLATVDAGGVATVSYKQSEDRALHTLKHFRGRHLTRSCERGQAHRSDSTPRGRLSRVRSPDAALAPLGAARRPHHADRFPDRHGGRLHRQRRPVRRRACIGSGPMAPSGRCRNRSTPARRLRRRSPSPRHATRAQTTLRSCTRRTPRCARSVSAHCRKSNRPTRQRSGKTVSPRQSSAGPYACSRHSVS